MEKKELAVTIAKDILIELMRAKALPLKSANLGDNNVSTYGNTLEALSKRILMTINTLKD